VAEQILVGAGVGSGVAFGQAFVLPNVTFKASAARFSFVAVKDAMIQLADDFESQDADGETANVLYAMAAILRDPLLLDVIKQHLSEGASVDRAVRGSFSSFSRQLQNLGGYFAQRSSDLASLADRVIRQLYGIPEKIVFPTTPFVLVTDSLSPIQAAELRSTSVRAVISSDGTPTSHSSIITRAASLPTVVGVVGAQNIQDGAELIVDASSGQVFIEPTNEERVHYEEALDDRVQGSPKSDITHQLPIKILANIGSSNEGQSALAAGAEGIGLFRTELLYLGRETLPTLQEQVFEYSKLFAKFKGKRVVTRLLDLDLDKPLPFLKPAGKGRYANRGLHVLLANREVLETQLRALAQASMYYPTTELWVFAPMVITAAEAEEFVALAKSLGLKTVGIMIEVPELAEPSQLARVLAVADFVSIGTNDLTQYVLGGNRHNGSLALSDARDPRVMSIIENVVAQAGLAGKPVAICGEAAADAESAKRFMKLGVDSLSASPALIPQLRVALAEEQP